MPVSRAIQAKADRLGPAGQRSSTPGAWLTRLQAEIAELIAERGALVESVTAGRDGLLVQPQAGQGALLRRQHSGTMSTWIGLDERNVYYYEHVWHRQRRWQTTRTPELIARIDALIGRVARLQAECKAAGRSWASMVKAGVTGVDDDQVDWHD